MAHLIVIAYEDEEQAREALLTGFELQREGIIELKSASVVKRRADGAVELAETGDVSDRLATLGGAAGGLILGAALTVPVIGAALGVAAGVAAARRNDLGIDDTFQREVGEKLAAGRAAVVFLVAARDRETALREASRLGGELLATDLAPNLEQQLRRILRGSDSAIDS